MLLVYPGRMGPQCPQVHPYNSNAAAVTPDQTPGINHTMHNGVKIAHDFETMNWANGSVSDEDFYRVPHNAFDAPAGALLKLQIDANPSVYTLPPDTALSRFLFQTTTLNGSRIPASAYILWPYLPRTQSDGYPVIGFAHGTSGALGNCAPSHLRNLWYQFRAPYALVLDGYVVVAPDYAGLGVDRDAKGNLLLHQYLAHPSHANDLFYSVQAAQSAFKALSKQFVIVGHSQGGGAAWAAAQRQALQPVDGYLGSIAASPITNVIDILETGGKYTSDLIGTLMANGLSSIFPSFDPCLILTPAGLEFSRLLRQVQGCIPVFNQLFSQFSQMDLFKVDWLDNFYIKAFQNLTINGGRPTAGPMLVLHGEADTVIAINATTTAVTETCEGHPNSQLEYMTFAEVSHDSILQASQRKYLKWIEDRFAGIPLHGCRRGKFSSARPYQYYQTDQNWYLKTATEPYQFT